MENERTTSQNRTALKIREICRRKGWNLGELARNAGISRTALYMLERGKTRNPHGSTLRKIARALEVTPEQLWQDFATTPNRQSVIRVARDKSDAELQRHFDRSTNPAVAEMAQQAPELFVGWSSQEWDELYSTFGTGGPLTPDGVEETANQINRKRETIQQLHVILETHLSEVAVKLIETLFQMACSQNCPNSTSTAGPSGWDG